MVLISLAVTCDKHCSTVGIVIHIDCDVVAFASVYPTRELEIRADPFRFQYAILL